MRVRYNDACRFPLRQSYIAFLPMIGDGETRRKDHSEMLRRRFLTLFVLVLVAAAISLGAVAQDDAS